ncbi:efflux RND transporter permease subunit [Leptolyngbya sp. CCNP1308]|uniref:efflux RND transporter permease subunit n=1 Tax=Leptolyngbya sp. CCNP1308 TaxID=3110255 RepID=UPI002B1FD4C4|nr:efflux RND transporter permease subunit [Leptolyngbya sp. CCNP1308]MEA5447152.1 efflux RND transporter permease subunit [Leptolyngbya sp. CCNP1308]
MNLSGWSIRRPIPVIVFFLVLTLGGLVSFGQLGIDENPNIEFPAITVTVTQTGAGPEELENQVTKPVEDAVAGLGDIDSINSTVRDGSSTTVISFILGTDVDRATNDVRDAVTRIRQDLPGSIQEPVIRRLEFGGGVVMTYAVNSHQRSVEELSDLVDRTISQEVLTVEGVARVDRVGGVDPEIRVDLDPEQLDALGITATQVNDQIRALNINLPSGRATLGGQEQSFRTLGSAPTVEAFQAARIVLPNGTTVPLTSLGTVESGFREARQSAQLGNQPVVAFSVYRSTGSVLVSVEDGVQAVVAQLNETLPEDVNIELIFTRATEIRDSYQASIDALILGCLLAVVVVGVFLRDWRATLVTATALPLSIIPTFLVLGWFDYTLNSMTLLALTLAVGNLVDDAIVEIENVERHIDMGKRPFQAALDSTAEVGLAVVTTTATIVAVFLPVAFMGGIPGQFFQPFGVTVVTATVFSTIVARLVTPMMAAYLLKGKPHAMVAGKSLETFDGHGEFPNGNGNGRAPRRGPYRSLLGWALRHRGVTVALALVFFVGSLGLVPYIPTNLFDSSDSGLSTISVELPPGATLADTQRVTTQLSEALLDDPAVSTVLATEGGDDGVNQATLYARLLPEGDRTVSQAQFEQQARDIFQQVPGARITFQSSGASGEGKDLSVVLKSDDPLALREASDALTREMRGVPGLVDVSSSASLVRPEVQIIPDMARAADLGVTVQAIAATASLATLGDTDANLADFNLGDRQIPIRVQIDPVFRDDPELLQTLRVPSQSGDLVPLAAVADVRFGSGPAQINRFDRSRQVTIGGNLQGITLGQGLALVDALPTMQNLPASVTQEPAGDAEIMEDIFSRFILALGTAVLMIFAVLVLLYNSFIYPMAIMAALPLSVGGALLALLIAQKPLGLFALIGIVLLMGLVTKNAILLVDYALMALKQGKTRKMAVMEAGVTRLRPILMTSISTMAGMVPIALEIGAGGETRSPMAIAVIGGFTTSTLLTLVVVPVLFTYIEQVNGAIAKLFARFRGNDGGPTPPSAPETSSKEYTLSK